MARLRQRRGSVLAERDAAWQAYVQTVTAGEERALADKLIASWGQLSRRQQDLGGADRGA
ncbi:MAG: hypothetical protein WDO24_18105 [Pseudomonadota bacterium]